MIQLVACKDGNKGRLWQVREGNAVRTESSEFLLVVDDHQIYHLNVTVDQINHLLAAAVAHANLRQL